MNEIDFSSVEFDRFFLLFLIYKGEKTNYWGIKKIGKRQSDDNQTKKQCNVPYLRILYCSLDLRRCRLLGDDVLLGTGARGAQGAGGDRIGLCWLAAKGRRRHSRAVEEARRRCRGAGEVRSRRS